MRPRLRLRIAGLDVSFEMYRLSAGLLINPLRNANRCLTALFTIPTTFESGFSITLALGKERASESSNQAVTNGRSCRGSCRDVFYRLCGPADVGAAVGHAVRDPDASKPPRPARKAAAGSGAERVAGIEAGDGGQRAER